MRARAKSSLNTGLAVVFVAACAPLGAGLAGCAPKCEKVKAALDDVQTTSEDVVMINALVDKRKAAVADASAGEHDTFALEKLRFSVTGYELAAETLLRVVKISPKFDNSPLYKEYRGLFDEMRCDFAALVGDPESHRITDAQGGMIQRWGRRVAAVLRNEGRLSHSELNGYLESGIRSEDDVED